MFDLFPKCSWRQEFEERPMVTTNLEDGKQAALVLHEESSPVFFVIGLNPSAESLNVQS